MEAAVATGKPVIVILTSGSAISANFAAANATAILEAWYGGEESGTAIAETLAGVNNPAGRLPVTFYKSVDQLPPFTEYAMRGRTYRYFKGETLYSFGFGLSYSTFQYSDLSAKRTAKGAEIHAVVKNTSTVDGDEVVQPLHWRRPGRRSADTQSAWFPADTSKSRRNPRGDFHGRCRRSSKIESGYQCRRRTAYRKHIARKGHAVRIN